MSQDTSWPSSPDNFSGTWKLENPSKFIIAPGDQAGQLKVTTEQAQGLRDATYVGELRNNEIHIELALKAAGVDGGGAKVMTVETPEIPAVQHSATGDAGQADWGANLEDFEGSWSVDGVGSLEIRKIGDDVAVLQAAGVPALSDGVVGAHFVAHAKALVLSFRLVNNGNVDSGAKEILFQVPISFPAMFGFIGEPTEGERFVEVDGGGG